MENQYGIQVTNKYQLFLDEDDDPLDILARQEEEKNKKKDDKSKKDSKNEKTAKSNKNKKNVKPLINQQEPKTKQIEERVPKQDDKPRSANQSRQGGERGPRRDRDQDRDRNLNKENKTPFPRGDRKPDPTSPSEFRDRADRPESGRGRGGFRRGRGRGAGRGGFGGDREREQRGGFEQGGQRGGFEQRGGFGKREYERHSGSDRTSGVKATDKRDGGGAHNWGTVRDDMEETFNESNLPEEAAPTDWTAAPAEESENPEVAVEGEGLGTPEDPGQAEMTLDEWKAQQMNQRVKADFKIRRAGEGVDDAQWKKMTLLKKKPPQDSDEEDEEDSDDEEWDERRGSRKAKVDIEITFNDNPRRGRGGRRGGRGMGRGRGEMGRGRGEMGRGRGEMGRGRGEMGRGRGEGGPRGGRGGFRGDKESAPRVDDEIDFPCLGKAAAS